MRSAGWIARALVLAAAASSAAAANRVWIVDSASSSIQAAVDAAADGDVVLVKAGHYAGFRIDDKAVGVVADDGAQVSIGGAVTVRDLGAQRDVVLAGLALDRPLWCFDASGSIRIESCRVLGDPTAISSSRHAALVERCRDVAFIDCTLAGASQLGFLPAGAGLSVSASNVALYGVIASGGPGWPGAAGFDGMPGADGLRASAGSWIHAAGSTLAGGAGGSGPSGGCQGTPCDGGAGGRGLALSGAGTRAHMLATTVHGGAGGSAGVGASICPSCPGQSGVDGADIETSTGAAADTIAGRARALDAPHIAREGAGILLRMNGEIGDRAGVLVALQTAFRFQPLAHGVATFGGARVVWLPATIDANGSATLLLRAPRLSPVEQARVLFLQSVHRDLHGDAWLGATRALTVVDGAL